MKPLIGALLLLTVAGSAGAQQGSGIFPFSYRLVELDNGFKAYLIKAGAPGQITYLSVVRTGSRDEVEPGKSGFAHFFEHMMFRGTEKYPNYDSVTAAIGAARNANTSNDRTAYYIVAASEYLGQIVDLESDRFMNLKYPEADFKTEAGAVLGEYQQGALSPGRFLDEKVRETAFDRHTYRHTTIGFEPDVRAMPQGYQYSLDFFRRFYRPENVVLILTGDFDENEAEALIREHYSSWKPGYEAPNIPVEPVQRAPRRRVVQYPGRTLPVLSVNYKSPAWSATDRDAVALEVLGEVAFGPNSDIYKRLVIEQRRVQYLQGDFGLSRDPGLVAVNAMVVRPDDVAGIEGEIQETIDRFKRELVDTQSLDDTKSNLKYGFLMRLETSQNVAFSLIPFVVDTGGIEAVDEYYRTMESITPEDLRAAAQKFLVDTGKTVVTMVQAGGAR